MKRIFRLVYFLLGLGLLVALAGEPVLAAPASLSLTVSNPYCVQAAPPTGACFINISSLYGSTTDSSFTAIEVSIAGKVRMRLQSFFESSGYLSQDMLGEGLQVPCGGPNAGGVPGYGKVYSVQLTAYATGSSPLTDIANVTCPFYEGKVYLPAVKR